MANLKLPKYFPIIILLSLITFALFTPSICVNIPLDSVPELLKQSALDSLNDNSPTGNTYKNGDFIRAEKLLEPPNKIYRLMLNLEPNCIYEASCLHEVCAIELREHELGVIDVKPDSIQCMYLYPQSDQAETQQQTTQDGGQNSTNTLEQDTTETFEKHIKDSSLQLDHEVQTVADGNERPFIAVRATDRNYCAGCPYELNPTLPGLAAYGEQVVQSMDDTGRSDFKNKVISIARVTRAVPPGSNVVLYELLLEIGETNCLRIGVSPRGDCSLLPNVPIKLCLVTFEQRPWQRDSQKIIRNNCTDLPDSYNALTDHLAEPMVTGDALYISETSSGHEPQLASSYPSSIDDFLGNTEKTLVSNNQQNTRRPVIEETATKTVVETNNAKVDDVQRFQDKYKEFDEFLENIDFYKPIKQSDPELPTDHRTPVQEDIIRPQIVVRTNSDGQPESTSNADQHNVQRTRRSLSNTLENEKELVWQLAQKVVDELDEIDIDNKKRILLDIIDSKKQLGDDTIYYITMKVAKSNCFEGTNDCLDDARDNEKICKAQIQTNYSESPDTAKVFQSQCFDDWRKLDGRFKRSLVGGWSEKSSEDPEIKDLGKKVLNEFAKTYKGVNEPLLVSIADPQAQVVSGMNYKMTVKFGESNCPKGEKGNHCQLISDSPLEEYFVTVWSQPWKDGGNPRITIRSTKEKKVDRVRRSNERVGGVTSIDPRDPKIQEYAKEGLSKYSETFGRSYEPYLVDVVESTQQIVSGTLNKIRIRVGESTCPKGVKENCQLKSNSPVEDYEVTVWSQPWRDNGHPDIKINVYSEKKKILKRSLKGQYFHADMLKLAKTLEYERAFERFIVDHEKTYNSEVERDYRLKVFQANMKRIEKLNENEQGTGIYGATMFADLTPDEFRSRHLGFRPELVTDNDIPLAKAEIPNIELPQDFDWRHRNVVTEVKDQGSCGSCWAFSVTGNVEALNAIKHGQLLSLSEQELVDCDKLDSGCNGGLPDTAYRALEQIGGLELENDYPYDGKDEKCHLNKNKFRVQITSGLNITSNETQMAQWLVQNGPISIGINANAMQFYMGGISHPFKFLCNGDDLDHGVLIVGFGIHTYPIFKKSMPYWIIKNSWGPRWGEQGYYRVYRGDGTCGLNRMATSAVIA